ncbi:hypothetical protein JCM15457_126 [Liquorilactobacillus sucicola DSM 21376 = JCM 15457]|uniref:YolD-like protein n=1 Tax=Liquorilactobacillus sucicola DSM 21376 = JCM 15457 TaxID=1423806 RepID=A0A023CUS9_9LACO|nr:hypothetical protein [Liquorilactobacillus sucicola]KRN05212.1 hypothetical protein FD15_GL001757 [Liquorilactobacillus sucicola DSM 21376 = JCM 15457]GAJ25270.1 hypothetical protein JCM15457_126 [Liquorilactobacillus sucicola DSM 21376 = JCM 15457]
MLELKKTTFQQLTQTLQSQFATAEPKKDSFLQQMPKFQLNFFINQAIQKHSLIKLCLLDTHKNEFFATGYINRSKDKKNYFKLDTLTTNISFLVNLEQIKYLSLA